VIRYHPVESVPSPRTPRIESTDAYPQQIMNRTTPASTCCSKIGSTPRAGWTSGKQTRGVLNAPACCNRHGAPPRAVRVHILSHLEYVNVARPGRTGHRTPPYVRRDARRDCSHQAGREARKALTGRSREDFARAFHPAAEDGVCPCTVQLTPERNAISGAISYHRGPSTRTVRDWQERSSTATSGFKRPAEEHTPAVQMARNGRSQRPVLVRWLMRGSASGAEIGSPMIRSPKGKIRRWSSKHVTARRPEPSGAHSAACVALGSAIVTTGPARAPILRTSHTCRGVPRSRT